MSVPWFLWSIVYPNSPHVRHEIRAHPVEKYEDQESCELAKKEYAKEVEKAHPINGRNGLVELICSPVNPR